ncbi:MAG: hypothetical protein IPM52_14450 [Bacteroidetes bacterium]|nr:hypothetical protein [Bacteroidota bacterium]
MNTYLKKLALAAIFSLAASTLIAQGPPPPPAGGHGQSTNQPAGGGAPIEGGIGILLALGAAYGARKVYKHWHSDGQE